MRGSFSASGLDERIECEVEIAQHAVTLLFDSTEDHAAASRLLDKTGLVIDFHLRLEDGRGVALHHMVPKSRARLTKMAWELPGVRL